jgi:hypothetical protein
MKSTPSKVTTAAFPALVSAFALFLALGCGEASPQDDSNPADSGPGAIDGQMPESDWGNDDGWYLIVRGDASACMVEPGGWWGATFEGPLTVSAGTFSWAGTHTEAHSWKVKDFGAPVIARGTVTAELLTMHIEVEGTPAHTTNLVMEPTDFGKDDDCWMNG